MAENQNCFNCRYYEELSDKNGKCHFGPPSTVGIRDNGNVIPNVRTDGWCGQWKPLPGQEEPIPA